MTNSDGAKAVKRSARRRKSQIPLSQRKRPKPKVKKIDLSEEENSTIDPGREVLTILHNLQTTEDDRRRDEVRRDLHESHARIKQILVNIGLPSSIPCTESETNIILEALNAPPNFNAKEVRAKMCRQQNMLDMVTAYMQTLEDRKGLIDDIGDWLDNIQDLEELGQSPERLEKEEKTFEEIVTNLEDAMTFAHHSSVRIGEIGYKILKQAGVFEEVDDEEDQVELKLMSKFAKNTMLPDTVLEEPALLADHNKFALAINETRGVLEQAIRLCKSKDGKALCRAGLKQYKCIVRVMEKKLEDLSKKEDMLKKSKLECERLQKSNERWKKQNEKHEKLARDLETQNKQLNRDMDKVIARNEVLHQEMEQRLAEQQQQHEALVAEMEEFRRDHPSPTSSGASLILRASTADSLQSFALHTHVQEEIIVVEQQEIVKEKSSVAVPEAKPEPIVIPTQDDEVEEVAEIVIEEAPVMPTSQSPQQEIDPKTLEKTPSVKEQVEHASEETAPVPNKESEPPPPPPSISTPDKELSKSQSLTVQQAKSTSQKTTSSAHELTDQARITESMISTVTQNLNSELDNLKDIIRNKNNKIRDLQKKIKEQAEETKKLQTRLNNAAGMLKTKEDAANKFDTETTRQLKMLTIKVETLDQELAWHKDELKMKVELVTYQEKRICQLRDELGVMNLDELKSGTTREGKKIPDSIRNTLMRMTNDYDAEINRLKGYIEKERSRSDANLRKLEVAHKDQLMGIWKQAIHMGRTVNRFKEALVTLLHREKLPLAANDIQKVSMLHLEEVPADPRLLFTQMAGGTAEILVHVEFKLSQILMNKRLDLKDKNIAQTFAVKDLELQTEVAKKAKMAAESLGEKYKEMKMRLMATEEALKQIRKLEDERFNDISERYRRLMAQFVALNRERDKVNEEHKITMKEKLRDLRKMVMKKDTMYRVVEEQQFIISEMHHKIRTRHEQSKKEFQMSIGDQRKNLELLDTAFKENKINKEMYEMTVSLIKESMKIPLLKLRHIFERYIQFCSFKKARKSLVRQLDDDLLTKEKKESVKLMLSRMDTRIEEVTVNWQHQLSLLEAKRHELFDRMDTLFCDVIADTGILLIPPTPAIKSTQSFVSLSVPPPSDQLRPLNRTRGGKSTTSSGYSTLPPIRRIRSPVDMPEELVGSKMPLLGTDPGKTWQLPPSYPIPDSSDQIRISVPRMVDMEVNQHLRGAQQMLQKVYFKPGYRMPQVEGFDYRKGLRPIHNSFSVSDTMVSVTHNVTAVRTESGNMTANTNDTATTTVSDSLETASLDTDTQSELVAKYAMQYQQKAT